MSINDYWLAKMQATEAGGEEAAPEVTEEAVEEVAEKSVVAALPAEEDVEPEDDAPEEDTYEADKAAATDKVPNTASNKETIQNYLIYEHGIDPEDLQDMTKKELLSLVADLEE